MKNKSLLFWPNAPQPGKCERPLKSSSRNSVDKLCDLPSVRIYQNYPHIIILKDDPCGIERIMIQLRGVSPANSEKGLYAPSASFHLWLRNNMGHQYEVHFLLGVGMQANTKSIPGLEDLDINLFTLNDVTLFENSMVIGKANSGGGGVAIEA